MLQKHCRLHLIAVFEPPIIEKKIRSKQKNKKKTYDYGQFIMKFMP